MQLTGVELRSNTLNLMSRRDPKQLILDAALAVFAELGYEHATTGHILSRGGISNGALFHHFPTKDAIAEALYVRGIAAYQEGLLGALERTGGAESAREKIKAAVHHHLAWVEANRDLARFIYERGRPDWQPAHGAAVRKLNRAATLHVRDWIAPLAAAGVVRELPLAVLAACVTGPAHFIARRWLSGMIVARPTSFADALADAAWAALAPNKPRRQAAPSQRISSAALIEAAALEAAGATCPASSQDDWTMIELTMHSPSRAPASLPRTTRIQSVRVEAGGCIAMVDVDLLNGDGQATQRGHVVCLRSKANALALSEGSAAAGEPRRARD